MRQCRVHWRSYWTCLHPYLFATREQLASDKQRAVGGEMPRTLVGLRACLFAQTLTRTVPLIWINVKVTLPCLISMLRFHVFK
jgi:hypothetical protein